MSLRRCDLQLYTDHAQFDSDEPIPHNGDPLRPHQRLLKKQNVPGGGFIRFDTECKIGHSFLVHVPAGRGPRKVDSEFGCSTLCLILPGLMGILLQKLGNWAGHWNPQIPILPNPGAQPYETPCSVVHCCYCLIVEYKTEIYNLVINLPDFHQPFSFPSRFSRSKMP